MKLNPLAFRVGPGMRRGHQTEVPIPTRLVSNEEFPPLPQTAAQREVEQRILAEAGRLAPQARAQPKASSCAPAAGW